MENCFFKPPMIQSAEKTLTPDASGMVASTALQTNTLYAVDTSTYDLTVLTLTAESGMRYCGLDFETGTNAPTLTSPSTWIWIGACCVGGDFTPMANAKYRIGIEKYGTTYVCTVQQLPEVTA